MTQKWNKKKKKKPIFRHLTEFSFQKLLKRYQKKMKRKEKIFLIIFSLKRMAKFPRETIYFKEK
jgi:hypothetical protein